MDSFPAIPITFVENSINRIENKSVGLNFQTMCTSRLKFGYLAFSNSKRSNFSVKFSILHQNNNDNSNNQFYLRQQWRLEKIII